MTYKKALALYLLSENLENLMSNRGMKFDAYVSNVGFILYLVAQVIPEPQKANQSKVPRFLIANNTIRRGTGD